MLDNHPNTLHLHSTLPSPHPPPHHAALIKAVFALDLCNGTECFDVCPKTLFVCQKSRNKTKVAGGGGGVGVGQVISQ